VGICRGKPIVGIRVTIVTRILTFIFACSMSTQAEEISIKIVRPTQGENLTISQGSTFVIGTVSPPTAKITINGVAADVSSDGAFIAFAPIQMLPKAQAIPIAKKKKKVDAVFECVVTAGKNKSRQRILVATPKVQDLKEPPIVALEKPQVFRVTQEQILSQTATTNWGLLYLPMNTLVLADERKGSKLRLKLGNKQETWIADESLQRADALPSVTNIVATKVSPYETRFNVGAMVPFTIEQSLEPAKLTITFYCSDAARPFEVKTPAVQPWGFAVCYTNNVLVLTQKPAPDLTTGFRGKVICLDPGHNPDSGALGPRGMEERDANLRIALALEKLLTGAGTKVVFTHRSEPMVLHDRRGTSVRLNPDIFVSIHNNSIPDGSDPRINWGASTFYYHPQSKALADTVQAAMLAELGFPDLKVNQKSLFVCRTTEFLSILTESAFMILPDQEKFLLSESGPRKIAQGIFNGIKTYFERKQETGVAH